MVAMDSFRVSSAQEALWLAQKLAPGLSNNIAAYLDISGDIDPSVMDAALRRVADEARSVLVNFVEDEDGPPPGRAGRELVEAVLHRCQC